MFNRDSAHESDRKGSWPWAVLRQWTIGAGLGHRKGPGGCWGFDRGGGYHECINTREPLCPRLHSCLMSRCLEGGEPGASKKPEVSLPVEEDEDDY